MPLFTFPKSKGGIPRGDQFGRILSDMFGNKKVEQWNTVTAEKWLYLADNYFVATLNYTQQSYVRRYIKIKCVLLPKEITVGNKYIVALGNKLDRTCWIYFAPF